MSYDSTPPDIGSDEMTSDILEALTHDHMEPAHAELARFQVAGSDRHQACRLQRRFDTKFVIPPGELSDLLRYLHSDYQVALAGESRAASYETFYFDTPELTFFNQHLRGRRPRFKVRVRHHLERQLSFFEIKRKNPGGSTSKFRAPIDYKRVQPSSSEIEKVAQFAGITAPLSLALEISCQRILFFHRTREERVTIDFGMRMLSGSEPARVSAVVLEVKQPRIDRTSPALQWCRTRGHRVTSLSKYCYGVAGLHESGNPRYFKTLPRKTLAIMGSR